MSNNESLIPSASVIGKEAGLVFFGAATGLLLSGVIGNRARKPLGLILGAVGVAAAGPEIAKLVDKTMNAPSTRRGSKKTLEDSVWSGKPVEDVDYLDEELGKEVFIG